MRKKFTMLLAALLLGLGATNAEVTKYYKPGERKATFAAGDKVMFYNTAINGDQDRTGFLIDNGSNFGHSKQKPSASPFFSEKVGVWTIEVAEDNTTYYKVNVKGTNGYVGIGGATNNAQAKDLFFHKWTESNKGDGVNSENVDGQKVLNADITEEDKVWVVAEKAGDGGTTWNGEVNGFATWSTGHPYAIYSVVEATTAELDDLLAQAKTTAKNTLAELANMPLYTVGTAADEVDAVVMENNDLETALNAIDAIVINVKKTIDGKNVTFQNHGSGERAGRFLGYDKGNSRAAAVVKYDNNSDEVIWTMKACDDGTFKLYNFANNLYLGAPGTAATHVEEASAPSFRFAASTNNTYPSTFVLVCSNGQWLHVENGSNYKLMSYQSTTDGASLWTVSEVGTIHITRDNYNAKSTVLNDLMAYAKQLQDEIGLVESGEKIAVVVNHPSGSDSQPSSNLLDGSNSTFVHSSYNTDMVDGEMSEGHRDQVANHYIEVELSEATRNIFCYFSKRDNNNRPAVIKVLAGNSAENITTEVATLTMGESYDNNVQSYFSKGIDLGAEYTHLRFVVTATNGGTKFFTLSEFYVLPIDEDTQNISNLTSASITDADINTKVAAAQSYLKGFLFADVYDVLQANKDKHAATPALGQYPTAAYEALEAAFNDDAATQETLEAAVAEFEKSKNLPVFTIDGVIDYAKDKSIYDDNEDAPNFKATDIYDRTMWWALDMTSTKVEVMAKVGITNLGTGKGFWGADNISVIETDPANDEDGIFMFKTNGEGSTIHAQNDNQVIVRYEDANAKTPTGGSAWKFTYLGNSYDLSKLTDEKIAALQALKTAVDGKSYLTWLEPGTGVGQYDITTEEYNAIVGPIYEASNLVNADLTEKAGYEVSQIEAFTTAVNAAQFPAGKLGTPVVGKYYRIKGANADAENYLTGNVTVNGNHIALQEDKTDATIFRYVNNKLLAVESNLYVAMIADFYTFQILEKNAPDITFAASSRRAGAYTINSDRYFHYNSNNTEGTFLDRCSTDPADHTAHDWCLEEVAESEVPANTNLLTDINNLSAEASYRIYGDRGFIYVADGALKSTYDAASAAAYNHRSDSHHFAVVTIGEKKYLYNVGAKKFVMKSGNTVALTDYPEHAITIEAAADQSTDFDWVINLNGSKLNQSAGSGHAYGIFTNNETEDEGNRWALYKVDEFAPEEAQSMKKVTVNYNVEGQTFTKNYGVAAGQAIDFSYAFATVTSCVVGEEEQPITDGACSVTVQDNMTIAVEIDETLPFEAARAGNNIPASAWLYLQMHSNNKKYIEYMSDNQQIEWADASVERAGVNTHTWALVGNVVEGFKLVNYAATTSKALKSTGNGNPAMDSYANGTAFVLANTTQSVDGGFCLQYPVAGGKYLNAGATLQHWGSADAGSTLVATKSPAKLLDELNTLLTYAATVVTIENDNTAALTTAKETAQGIYDATTEYSAEIEGAYEPLNTAIDNVIKAEVDSRLFRLKHSASENLYMTIVTPEAAAGIKIMGKAADAAKQAFYIAATENLGVYNIKSTENYFMASSGAWHYGAYETANENGRAHNVEYLGEGKYALKTLNGYAGSNDGAITAESPLYSNHPKTRTTIQWELEELPKSSITYIYKWNDQTITSEVHENVYEGLAAPATAVTLPFGFSYDAAQLPATKGAGNQVIEIACTLSLPFQYAATYQAIEENGYWYYLKFDSDNNFYLHHAAGQDHIALDSKAVDKKNKDVYSWGFVGDPINGFKIVNKAAGSTMILSSSTTMAGDAGAETWPIMTVEEGLSSGNNTHWIPTASTHAQGGFFLAQKGHSTHRMNNRGSKLAYWTGGAGTGSTFVVEARPFGPVAELEELLIEAKELKAVVDDNTGDKIGEYSAATATALANAITTAEGVTEPTADDVTALENVVLGTKIILPTAGTYYQIHSATPFTETKAVYSNGNAPMWKTLNEYDRSFYWLAVETADGGIALQNAQDEKFMNGASNQSGAWTVSETSSAIDVKILTKEAHEKGYQYGIILNDWQLHANGHSDGNGTSGNIVSYNTEKDNASAWYIVEAELPSFFPVTYKFNFGGETKYTQEKLVAVGGAYPEMEVFLPYGVTSDFERPAETVQAASEHVFNLAVNKALPFEAVAEGNTPSKWYYAQMHAYPGYAFYVSANEEDKFVWQGGGVDNPEAKYIDEAADLDDYLWGFVGDLWTGFKLVNKAGKAVSSTGSGDVTVVDGINNATKFIASNSKAAGEWFCMKYPTPTGNKYLNLDVNKTIIQHWTDNDNGSSFFVTEYDKSYPLNMETTGYATFYSQYRVAIPEGVQAWVVSSIENNEVNLDEVEGNILPANTGVILTGEGTPSIVTSAAATAEVGANLLQGTVTKTLIEAAANTSYYVLANGVNGVKLYKAMVNKNAEGNEGNTHFYNNANKVYLPVEVAEPQAAQALAFRFRGKEQGTTEIEVPAANDLQPAVIYDLTGRRITEIVEKGVYIVNGKKVIIK